MGRKCSASARTPVCRVVLMENISIIINVQQRGGQQLCKSSSGRRSQNDQLVIIALGDGDSFVFSRMLSTEAAVWENRDPVSPHPKTV